MVSVPVLDYVATRPGGDTQAVGNFEYRIPIAGPVSMSLFTDIGIDGILRRSQLLLRPQRSIFCNRNTRTRIFRTRIYRRNCRLPAGTNFQPRASSGIEFVVQLPIVNAPFRFYYAYNPLTLDQTIVSPRGAFFISDDTVAALCRRAVLGRRRLFRSSTTFSIMNVQRLPTSLLEPSSHVPVHRQPDFLDGADYV